MKALKILLFVVLGIVVLGAILVMVAPNDYTIRETATIDAPKPLVHRYVSLLKHHSEWNPWKDLDPDMTIAFSGEKDGTPGYKYTWSGEINGDGYQEITSVSSDEVEIDLVFTSPFESVSKINFTLNEVEGGTEVIWNMDGSMPAPINAVLLFSDMGMGSDFQKGLKNLEKHVQEFKKSPSYNGYEVKMVSLEGKKYVGKRAEVPFDKIPTTMEQVYSGIKKSNPTASFSEQGALYFTWDTENEVSDMAPVMPFDPNINSSGYDVFELTGDAIQVDFYGVDENTIDAHMALEQYTKEFQLPDAKIVWEDYQYNTRHKTDTSKWLTRITYIL